MKWEIMIIETLLTDGSPVYAVRLSNGLHEKVLIDAIDEDHAQMMGKKIRLAMQAHSNEEI